MSLPLRSVLATAFLAVQLANLPGVCWGQTGKLFAGMMLFASNEKRYKPHLGIEQHGNIFYRDSITSGGQSIPELSEKRTVQVDILELVAEALRQGREKQPRLSANIDQYAIYNFSIGFEGMGHWESVAEISDLSFTGTHRKERNKQ